MKGLKELLDSLKDTLESAGTQDQFVRLIDVATATLQKAINVSKFEFVKETDEEHFENQISSIIEQVEEMYDWAIGKMKP